MDLTYPYEHLGSEPAALEQLLAGNSPFLQTLASAQSPAIVLGPGTLRRADRDAILSTVHQLVEKAGGCMRQCRSWW